MGPRRKKTKQSPPTDQPPPERSSSENSSSPPHKKPENPTQSTCTSDQQQRKDSITASPPSTSAPAPAIATNRGSWYSGGSWRAKASPVAQATRESISVAGGATSESLAEGAKQTGRYVHNSLRRSTKSIPTISLESIIHATGSNATGRKPSLGTIKPADSDAKKPVDTADDDDDKQKISEVQVKDKDKQKVSQVQVKGKDMKVTAAATTSTSTDLKPLPADTTTQGSTPPAAADPPLPPEPANNAAGWFGWWSRPDGYPTEAERDKAVEDGNDASGTPLPSTPDETPQDPVEAPSLSVNINDTMKSNRSVESTRSWFGMWTTGQNLPPDNQEEEHTPPAQETPPTHPPATEQAQKPQQVPAKEPEVPETKPTQSTPNTKSSGWAFWSRQRGEEGDDTPNGTQRQVGELAVADTPSQSHPEAAQFNEQRPPNKKSKLGRPASISSTASLSSASQSPTVSDAAKVLESTKTIKSQAHPNLVIPSFDESYSTAYIPTYLERLTTYVASSLKIIETPTSPRHVSITPTAPKIKNAIALGVHGYFPAPLIQKVLGQPTGTSIRFANYASASIRDWVQANQPDTPCDIETVALEGEGFIADRVATLWKLLLNWLSHLRQADLILVACHSQGVPVAIMLVHKLLQLGCLSPHAKIGICAMAGVNLGPFADYKSRLLGAGAAAELFEFSRQDSRVSTEYKAALDGVLRHGVRITYCGSIDDQLVSLESSTFSTLNHPYVYRAVFVDGRLHAPNFLTHLVAFALKLRNLGVSDHNLIRELSLPLAGSLYGGEGHSRIYDDPAVYNLALRFTLETTDVAISPSSPPTTTEAQQRRSSRGGPPSSVSAANSLRRGSVSAGNLQGIGPVFGEYETPASGSNANPYFLPWALRGILEEDVVRGGMGEEVRGLVKLFEEWRPTSKVLKDVRFRLEGVRSKM